MHKVIRDDVISLESYTAAAFKYDALLETLLGVGGYVFVTQLKSHFGKNQAKHIISGAEEANLIKTVKYSNYKYIYLTSAGSRYLKSKRVGLTEPVEIYKKVEAYPSDRKLFVSAYKWHLVENKGYSFAMNENYEKSLRAYLADENSCLPVEKLEEEKHNYVIKYYEKTVLARNMALQLVKSSESLSQQIAKQLANDVLEYRNAIKAFDRQIELTKEFNEKIDERISKGITLFKISKIILLPEGELLRLIIFDAGKINAISTYIRNIESFEKSYGIRFSKIVMEFITYDEERFKRFEKKVNVAVKKEMKRILELMPYDPSIEIFKGIRDSKSVAESIAKRKDERKFDEIVKALGS